MNGVKLAVVVILATAMRFNRTDLPGRPSASRDQPGSVAQLPLPAVTAVLYASASEVCFDVPKDAVDWDAVADSALGTAIFRNPPADEMRRRKSSVFPFSRALSPMASAMGWRLVRASGVTVLHPRILRGRVEFSVDTQFVVKGRAIEGKEACAPTATSGGGFVFSGIGSSGWRVGPGPRIKLASHKVNAYRFVATIDGQAYPFEVYYENTVLLSRLVRRGPQAFLLIEWKDVGFCSEHFSLFAVHPPGELRLVSESVGDCRGD